MDRRGVRTSRDESLGRGLEAERSYGHEMQFGARGIWPERHVVAPGQFREPVLSTAM